MIYKANRLELKGTGLSITMRCTLKCKLCCTYSPYYEKAPHYTFEELKRTIDKYFSIVDHVGKFTLSGGEPFMHPELHKIVDHMQQYFDKVGTFEIITNGTLLPKQVLLDSLEMAKEKVAVMIDRYDELSPRVDEIAGVLADIGVNHRIRNYGKTDPHCGGWVDFGDFSLIHMTEDEVIAKYNKCAYPQKLEFCFSIMNGEIHPCTPSRRAMELGVIDKDQSEYIDLFDESLTDSEIKAKFKGIVDKKYLTACAYCNGLCDDSERFIPAEQIE